MGNTQPGKKVAAHCNEQGNRVADSLRSMGAKTSSTSDRAGVRLPCSDDVVP